MLEKNNRYKVLKVFLMNSLEEFGLREIARLIELSPTAVKTHLLELVKQNLIKKKLKKGLPLYFADRDNQIFKTCQKISIIYELESSGLVDFLWEKLAPSSLVLFGSYYRGEAIDSSDVDIYIGGKERKLDLSKFDARLGLEVHLVFEKSLGKISKELKNNIANGVVLRGNLDYYGN